VDRLLAQAYDEHLRRLTARMGLELEPVTSSASGRVWRLPRPEGSGEVLLVRGSGERVMQAVMNRVANTPGSGRFAIVRLVPAVERGPAWEVQRRDIRHAWEEQLKSLAGAHTYVQVTLPLDEYLAAEGVEERWTQATADELLIAELWVDRAWRRFAVTSEETQDIPAGPYLVRPSGSDVAEESRESLERVLTDWVASNDQVLCWVTEEPSLDAVATLFGRPLTGTWAGNVYLPATASVPEKAAAALWDLPVEEAGSRLASLARLIEDGRIVLGLNYDIYGDLPYPHVLPATAAIALHSPGANAFEETVSTAGGATTLRATRDPETSYNLGVLVRSWDPNWGRQLVEETAGNDHPEAMATLALWLLPDDPKGAQQWRERLLETGDMAAIRHLAQAMDADGLRDARMLEALAARGSAWAMARLAHELLESDHNQAASRIDELIATNDTREIEWLAGATREEFPGDSLRLFEAAVRLGSQSAARMLVVWSDANVASTWRKWLLESGDVERIADTVRVALNELPDSADEWFRLASESDDHDLRLAIADTLADRSPKLAEQLRARASAR
jgi:hypothetical protein